jgi:nucleotide-binding universal stress UspA family protein
MKYLVGFSPDRGGHEALSLATVLARSTGGSLVVCIVVPSTWDHPSFARVDAEYASFLAQHAEKALASARAAVPEGIDADFVARSAASASDGLLSTASDVGADCIVLGSARSAMAGAFSEGLVTTDVLHSAGLPVALAPRGYTAAPDDVIRRVTCAVSGIGHSASLAARAGEFAAACGVGLRLATFIVRDKQMYPTGAGYDAENMVANQLRDDAQALHDTIREHWHDAGAAESGPGNIGEAYTDAVGGGPAHTGRPTAGSAHTGRVELSSALGDGATWRAALGSLPWVNEELLIIGSSRLGPIMRVFIGSNSGKIARYAPVPRLVLPRIDA